MKWFDGGKKPPCPEKLDKRSELHEGGQLYIGAKYTIMAGSYATGLRIIPADVFSAFRKHRPAEKYLRSPGHFVEWINACKGGEPAQSNFDYAGPLTEVILLGNLALRTGKKIICDPEKRKILNLPEDHPFIRPSYRRF